MKSVLLNQSTDLDTICSVLNGLGPADMCLGLRGLVEAWKESGPNLNKLLRDDPALEARVREGGMRLVATDTGKGHLIWLPIAEGVSASSCEDHALAYFKNLVVNPEWEKLGGPCPRCEQYYVKKTSRQKTYCSRRCGANMTATASTRRRRQAKRVQKLLRAQEFANEWATVHTQKSWKEWISAQTKMEITVKWLTRAVNKGDLTSPAKNIR